MHYFNNFLFLFTNSCRLRPFPLLPLGVLFHLSLALLVRETRQIPFERVTVFGFEFFEAGVRGLHIDVVNQIKDNVLEFFQVIIVFP